MPSPYLLLLLLLSVNFTLATCLGLWQEQSARATARSGSVLEVVMGDSRRLFANHFFVKADAYLHSGVYPSFFDQAQSQRKSHLAEAASGSQPEHSAGEHNAGGPVDEDHDHEDSASGFLGRPKDWIDAFGRNFFPTRHTHLARGQEDEILPWLRVAADLNPNEIETYTVGGYWLRRHLGRVQAAEDFLREGWRANPHSFAIELELARLYEEDRKDPGRARNLYEAALQDWDRTEAAKAQPDKFTLMQILARLGNIEESAGHFERAILFFERLSKISPDPKVIQKRIDALKARLPKVEARK